MATDALPRARRARRWAAAALLLLQVACARGAGPDAPGFNPTGTDAAPTVAVTAGLTALVAGDGVVRLDWQRPPAGYQVSLYYATDPRRVYDGAPLRELLPGGHVVLSGLQNGLDYYFGLAIRAALAPHEATAVQPVGVVLHGRPGPVVFVDAAATDPGDGRSPRTAFADLQRVLAGPAPAGGRNIWIRNGEYSGSGWVLAPGDQLFGGFGGAFGTDFDLHGRLPQAGATVLRAAPGPAMLLTAGGEPGVVLDGLTLRGQPTCFVGLEADNAPVELRSVEVREFGGRGVVFSNTSRNSSITCHLAAATFRGNGAEGLFVTGAYDLRVHGCRFQSNQQEGFDCDDLIALEGETASLHVTACLFHGNAAEGMDVDLNAPNRPGTLSGRFTVSIRGCTFSRNLMAGLLIDEEYELAPLWSARIVVRECTMRDNGGPGIHVDDDGLADVLIHRCTITANGGDGVLVASESLAGFAVLSSSVIAGNVGTGARATFGQKGILATHCVFSGNQGGGLRSEVVESGATSCVAWLQPAPWTAVRQRGVVTVADPGTGVFRRAPRAFAQVVAHVGAELTLDRPLGVAVDDVIEIADDGIARVVTAVAGTTLVVRPAPQTVRLPVSIARHGPAAPVAEDWRLVDASPAAGAGMALPGGDPVDAGVAGAPDAGGAGVVDPAPGVRFWLTQTSPAWTAPIPVGKTLVVAFSGEIDAGSVEGRVRAFTAGGATIPISLLAFGDQILVFPPATGWGTEPFSLELHAGIRGSDSTPVCTPLSLPLRTN